MSKATVVGTWTFAQAAVETTGNLLSKTGFSLIDAIVCGIKGSLNHPHTLIHNMEFKVKVAMRNLSKLSKVIAVIGISA
jgi:hypothetical protein